MPAGKAVQLAIEYRARKDLVGSLCTYDIENRVLHTMRLKQRHPSYNFV